MKKSLTLFGIVALLAITLISVNVLADPKDQVLDSVNKYYQYGQLLSEAQVQAENNVVATIEGEPIAIDDAIIKSQILMGNANTETEAVQYLVTQKLLLREAEDQGIIIDNKEVNDFIKKQKESYNSKDAKEYKAELDEFIRGLGLTEEEYWIKYYEEYRSELVIRKLQIQLYDTFLYKKVVERINELGITLSDEEIHTIFENEKHFYNEKIQSEFSDYYIAFEKGLWKEYNTKIYK